jgi:hypothetical protein
MRESLFSVYRAQLSVEVLNEGSRGVFTPFNSLVLEIVAVSKAFVVASTAAMIVVDLGSQSESDSKFCIRFQLSD